MANSSLEVSSLDFDTLKTNLKNYLKNQSVFRDYDFEGSNMNVLLSLLSYNSYLNSFYLNMVAAESFLDSAQLRDSVVSHAKTLNYLPSSYKSPEAIADVRFVTNGIGSIFTIPKGTQFSGSNSNGTFTYVTDRVYTVNSGNGTFIAEDLKLYEGSYVSESFVKNDAIENQRFILSNENIDTESLVVQVFENSSVVGTDYLLAKTLYGITDTSNVYYLQAFKNQYEIIFGDGVFGNPPKNGATITVSYRITNGTNGGGINSFILDNDLGAFNNGQATATVTVTTTASSGANAEPIETIRFRAPRAFQTQNRAVTTEDYKTLILDQFREIKTLNAYGGETDSAVSINYGKIIISPITYSGAPISQARKQEILDFIIDKMSVGLTPLIIDPEILYIAPRINVKYDPRRTSSTANAIKQLATTAVQNYNNTYLKEFNTSFIESDFIDFMMQIDPGIVSVNINNYVESIVSPEINRKQSLTVAFNNKIIPTNITSTQFLRSDGIFYTFADFNPNSTQLTTQKNDSGISVLSSSDDNLYLVSQQTLNTSYVDIGTIDYENGIIYIYDLIVSDFGNNAGIKIFAVPFNKDITATKNQIIEFNLSDTQISVSNI